MGKILFVDDDQTMRNAIKVTLKDFDLKIAENKKEAIKLLESEEFDLLLTDLFMPEKEDGLNLVEEAREMDDNIYIVVVTGFGTIESAVEAVKLGADDYIMKPFDMDDFLHSISMNLKIARLNKDMRTLERLHDTYKNLVMSLTKVVWTKTKNKDLEKEITVLLEKYEECIERNL